MIALIDGDILVYECGFASDAAAKRDGRFEGHEPLEYALQNVKQKIADIMEITNATEREIYITGEDNYREALYPAYKQNRDPNHKPHWYHEIKEYLEEVQGSITVNGMEADDILGIRQCTEQDDHTIICSKDKDLDCIPGFHYNWSPTRWANGVYTVSETEANQFFYTQCLTGDTTDNIPGLKKLTGQVATKKKKEPLLTMTDPLEMYEHVKKCYGGVDFHLTAQLLWILRDYEAYWKPPTGETNAELSK